MLFLAVVIYLHLLAYIVFKLVHNGNCLLEKDFVDGNFECEFYTFIRPINQGAIGRGAYTSKYDCHDLSYSMNNKYLRFKRHTHLPFFPCKEAKSVFNSLTVILYAAKMPSSSINLSNEKKKKRKLTKI
jgi:hypothetical protein